jgi:hypothetical protein
MFKYQAIAKHSSQKFWFDFEYPFLESHKTSKQLKITTVSIVLNGFLLSNKTFLSIIRGLIELPWEQNLEHFKNLSVFF